jgi:hypothetical protein
LTNALRYGIIYILAGSDLRAAGVWPAADDRLDLNAWVEKPPYEADSCLSLITCHLSRITIYVLDGKGEIMGKRKVQKSGQTKGRPARRRIPGVPPPDSAIWPEQYRGERWKPIYGLIFAGKCQLCAYSCPLPKSRQLLDKWHGQTRLLLCTNHPGSSGELREVLPIDTCRNFKAKSWQPARCRPAQAKQTPPTDESDPTIRRIPVGQGLFAIVDAEDYEKLSQYTWYASRRGRTIYATCIRKGRVMYMHRMIMRARKGCIVDHIDGNGLNNRRCNLRICTHQQNQANRGSRGGSSGFVGIYRHKDKWVSGFRSRGKYYYLGLYESESEAARARDRKAYEMFGEHAYINLPEDLVQWLRDNAEAPCRCKAPVHSEPNGFADHSLHNSR